MIRSKARLGFTLIELMIVVAILGILAVVAIPAFVRYMRIAKTAEAYRNIALIVKGEIGWFTAPHFDENGQPLPCSFPHAPDTVCVGGPGGMCVTPTLGSCCSDGEADAKCEPNEYWWSDPEWKKSLFKLSDKHYYVYGQGRTGSDTAAFACALGDLDCDGTYSTFAAFIAGSRGANNIVNCTAGQKSGIATFNETE